jgi:putative ABC transport system permease protein
MNLAIKDIRHNLGRFILTTLGVGLLLMVVMGQWGGYRGMEEDATFLIENVGADLWVVQGQTKGPFAELSRVPRTLKDRLAAVPGVRRAGECLFFTVQRQHAGRDLRMNIFGLDWPTDNGEWLPLIAGRPLGQNHYEMIADRLLGLSLGEQVTLAKDTYTVVGITKGMVSPSGDGLGFFTTNVPGEAIRLERAARPARARKIDIGRTQPQILERAAGPVSQIPAISPHPISGVMVSLEPDADPDEVAAIISSWPDVAVLTRSQQHDLMLTGIIDQNRRQIRFVSSLLLGVSAVVLMLIVYTLTLERTPSIALLKLIGAPNRVILGMVLQQAFLIGGFGYGVGYLLGQVILPYFPRRVVLVGPDLLLLAFIVAGMCILGSLLGMWKAASVSPNEVLS